MRTLETYHSVGASLASVAILAGITAVLLGWMTPGSLPAVRSSSPDLILTPPQAVEVTVLPAGPPPDG